MLVEITNTASKDIELNRWYLVRDIDNVRQSGIYVHFKFAYDYNGNALYKIPQGATILVDMEYNGNSYP